MRVTLCCGKGGVGKTTIAVSLGIFFSSQGEKTAIIDYDGGHSVKSTLGIGDKIPPNKFYWYEDNLQVFIVEDFNFVPIHLAKERGDSVATYLKQFPGDAGIIPLADMVNSFFGVPTDMSTLQKFTILVDTLLRLERSKFDNAIIDVEPTAGFERLVSNATATVRSLRNLQNQGALNLGLLKLKWPDISAYLKGDYIKNADLYCRRIEWVVRTVRQAFYFVICIPEVIPIQQTFDVRQIIRKFRGEIQGIVINNVRGEPYEEENLKGLGRVREPRVKIMRQNQLHEAGADRKGILLKIGKEVAENCLPGY